MLSACLGLAFLCGTFGCKKANEPSPASHVGHDDVQEGHAGGEANSDQPSPLEAGSLRRAPVVYRLAVYASPEAKSDVVEAAKQLHREAYSHLEHFSKDDEDLPPKGLSIEQPQLDDFAPPDASVLRVFGRGLSDTEIEAVQRSPEVVVLHFASDLAHVNEVYRDAVGLVGELSERVGGYAWDEETRELFTPAAWKERRSASVNDPNNLPRHFTLHAYRDGELMRLVTLGMVKFGLPDLVIEQVPSGSVDVMNSLVNVVAITMATRPTLQEPGLLDVDVSGLPGYEVLGDAPGKGQVQLVVGEPDEGDPLNRLVEIAFPGPTASVHERQNALCDQLFGSSDSLETVNHDEELLAASARARKQLDALRPRFEDGLPDLEHLMVKAPFETSSGGREWMWVEVTQWNGETLRGILSNDPFEVPELKAGAKVEVERASVFDYLYRKADGTIEGGETSEILKRRQAEK